MEIGTKIMIGFATEFYTYWSINTDFNYNVDWNGNVTTTGIKIQSTYLGKLSKDLDKAKQKMVEKGFTEFGIDENLRGLTRSYTRFAKNYCDIPKKDLGFFAFGKYENQLIEKCNDLNYLSWYFGQTQNVHAKNVLINSNQYVIDEENFVYTIEQWNEIQETKKQYENAIKNGFIDFEPTRNLNSEGCYELNYNIKMMFKDFKEMYYNGYSYALPVLDKCAKKIKGKKIRAFFSEYHNNEFLINNWEFIN